MEAIPMENYSKKSDLSNEQVSLWIEQFGSQLANELEPDLETLLAKRMEAIRKFSSKRLQETHLKQIEKIKQLYEQEKTDGEKYDGYALIQPTQTLEEVLQKLSDQILKEKQYEETQRETYVVEKKRLEKRLEHLINEKQDIQFELNAIEEKYKAILEENEIKVKELQEKITEVEQKARLQEESQQRVEQQLHQKLAEEKQVFESRLQTITIENITLKEEKRFLEQRLVTLEKQAEAIQCELEKQKKDYEQTIQVLNQEKTALSMSLSSESEKATHALQASIAECQTLTHANDSLKDQVIFYKNQLAITPKKWMAFSLSGILLVALIIWGGMTMYHEKNRLMGITDQVQQLESTVDQTIQNIASRPQQQPVSAPVPVVDTEQINQRLTQIETTLENKIQAPTESQAKVVQSPAIPNTYEMVYFQLGSMDIPQLEMKKLEAICMIVLKDSTIQIRLEGHTDNQPIRWTSWLKYGDNIGLSLARASAVARAFVQLGINPNKITMVGLGDSQPVLPNTENTNKAKNRRVDIKLVHIN